MVADESVAAQREAEQGDAHAPEHATDDRVDRVGAVVHLPDAGDDGDEGAHDRHEPCEHDGARTVLVEELVGLVDVRLLEEPGVGPVEQRRAGLAPDQVSHLVAGDGGDADEHDDQLDRLLDLVVGDQQADGEQQRVAGQEEADQQTALGEDDDQGADQPEGLDQLVGVEPGRAERGDRHGDEATRGRLRLTPPDRERLGLTRRPRLARLAVDHEPHRLRAPVDHLQHLLVVGGLAPDLNSLDTSVRPPGTRTVMYAG